MDSSQLQMCRCVHLSQLTILYRLKGDFGWMHTDVRCGDWMGTVPRGTELVRDLHVPCPVSQPLVWQATAPFSHPWLLPAIPGAAGCAALLFYCTLLMILSNGLLEWVKKLLKYSQDSAWFLGCPLVLYLRPLKVLWLWFEGWALLCLMQWLSCFCISWWFQATSLLIRPGVPAAVSACTTAGSWMCPLCAAQQGPAATAELDKILLHLRRIFL